MSGVQEEENVVHNRSELLELRAEVAQLKAALKRQRDDATAAHDELKTLKSSVGEERELRWISERTCDEYRLKNQSLEQEVSDLKQLLEEDRVENEKKMKNLQMRMDSNTLRRDLDAIQQRCLSLEMLLRESNVREEQFQQTLIDARLEDARLRDRLAIMELESKDVVRYAKIVKWLSASYFVKLFRMRKFLRGISNDLMSFNSRIQQELSNKCLSIMAVETMPLTQTKPTLTVSMGHTNELVDDLAGNLRALIGDRRHWKDVGDQMFSRVITLTNTVKQLKSPSNSGVIPTVRETCTNDNVGVEATDNVHDKTLKNRRHVKKQQQQRKLLPRMCTKNHKSGTSHIAETRAATPLYQRYRSKSPVLSNSPSALTSGDIQFFRDAIVRPLKRGCVPKKKSARAKSARIRYSRSPKPPTSGAHSNRPKTARYRRHKVGG